MIETHAPNAIPNDILARVTFEHVPLAVVHSELFMNSAGVFDEVLFHGLHEALTLGLQSGW